MHYGNVVIGIAVFIPCPYSTSDVVFVFEKASTVSI
jgi:hypothetical protein